MDKPLNPVDVENQIYGIANEIAKGVRVVSEREKAYADAKRVFDVAEAKAIMAAQGTVLEKKAQVTLAVIKEREAMDVAYAAWRYADKRAKALNYQLDALRSIGVSVRNMYATAGRGEA